MKKSFWGVIGLFLIVNIFQGCTIKKNDEKETWNEETAYKGSVSEYTGEDNIKYDEKELAAIANEIIKLNTIDDLDKTVIFIDGQKITKKEVEIQKIYSIYLPELSLKERIENLIEEKVVTAEADRLGIKPNSESVESYIQQVDKMLEEKAVGTEITFAYIGALGINKDEYMEEVREIAYDIFQREALWETVEKNERYNNYEEYVNSLIEKADVQILDPTLKEILL